MRMDPRQRWEKKRLGRKELSSRPHQQLLCDFQHSFPIQVDNPTPSSTASPARFHISDDLCCMRYVARGYLWNKISCFYSLACRAADIKRFWKLSIATVRFWKDLKQQLGFKSTSIKHSEAISQPLFGTPELSNRGFHLKEQEQSRWQG